MAEYTLRVLKDEPIILFTREAGEWQAGEMSQSMVDTIALLDAQPGPMFLVLDLLTLSLDLSDSLAATTMASRGPEPMLHHPKLRETIIVTTDPMMQHSVRAMAASPTFGFARVSHVETVADALTYCRLRLAETRGLAAHEP